MARASSKSILYWFLPPKDEQDPMDRPNYMVFVLLHLLGPLTTFPLFMLLFAQSDNHHVFDSVVFGSIMLSAVFPFLLRWKPQYFLGLTIASVQNLLFAILFAAFTHGGATSPILVWLLSVPIAAFLVLGSTPVSRLLIGGVTTFRC